LVVAFSKCFNLLLECVFCVEVVNIENLAVACNGLDQYESPVAQGCSLCFDPLCDSRREGEVESIGWHCCLFGGRIGCGELVKQVAGEGKNAFTCSNCTESSVIRMAIL
jgi:hypothetical protein